MEAEAVGGEDRAGTSSSIAATATCGETPAVGNDPAEEKGVEFIAGADAQPPQPGFQYSADLRRELSQDVLASLDGPAPGDARAAEDSMMDLACVRSDMEFISDLSSLSLPVDHGDPVAAPAAGNFCIDIGPGLDGAGNRLQAEGCSPRSVSLLESPEFAPAMSREAPAGGNSSLPFSDPTTSDVPLSGPLVDVTAEPSPSSGSFSNSLQAIATASLPGEIRANSSASQPALPVHVVTTIDSSGDDSFRAWDPGADPASSFALQERVDGAGVDAPLSDSLPQDTARKQEAHEGSCHPEDILPASPVPRGEGSAGPVDGGPSQHMAEDIVRSPRYEHLRSNTLTSVSAMTSPFPVDGEPARESSSGIAEASLVEAQRPTSEKQGFFLHTQPVTYGLLSSTADIILPDGAQGALAGSPSASESLLIASGGVPPGAGPSFAPPAVLSPPFPSVSTGISKPNMVTASSGPRVTLDTPSVVRNNPVLDTSRASLTEPLSQAFTTSTVEPRLYDTVQPTFTECFAPPSMSPTDCPSLRHADGPPSQLSAIPLSLYFDGSSSPFRGRKSARKKKSAEGGTDLEETKGKVLSDVEQSEEVAELERMLEAQKRMVQWQIDEIQRITALQTQLTGTNPLSDEVAWQVLGVKGGGKTIGDSISPEALRSLQDIFSIKDTLTKKEARDISCNTGASLPQVREFFAAKRSLVRKLVQQAHDEAGRPGIKNASEQSQELAVFNSISEREIDLEFEKLSGAESVERLLEAMRTEKAFAGRGQILHVILHTDAASPSLRRFLEKGGLKILGAWLVESVAEEQTTIVSKMLKVLSHLPMSTAYSHQMSPFIQSVNKLRFHHVPAVAGQAVSVFTKWCKLFSPKSDKAKSAKSPANESSPGAALPAGGPKRSRDSVTSFPAPRPRHKKARAVNGVEVSQIDSKASPGATPKSPGLNGITQGASDTPSSTQLPIFTPPTQSPVSKPRWSSTLQPSESAVAAVSVSRKRLGSKPLADHSKDRRKLLPVDGISVGKTVGSKPATVPKNSRPLSTDDIYKAKKLERLMQEPVGKSKKRPREQLQTQNAVLQAVSPSKALSPSAFDQPGAVKEGSVSALSPIQGIQRGEAAIRTGGPDDDGKLQGEHMKSQSPELLNEGTITPVSSQEPQLLTVPTISIQEGSGSEPFVGQLPKGVVDVSRSDHVMSDDVGNSIYAPQEQPVMDLERDPYQGFEDTLMPSPSHTSFQEREEEPSSLSESHASANVISKSATNVLESRADTSLEKVPEASMDATPSPNEAKLSALYASLRASMVRWRIPPEFQVDEQWSLAAGEDSKEKEFQSVRVKREEEAYYPESAAIPDNPKDPWEEEPNYDDSLTLEIFVESERPKVLFGETDQSDLPKPSAVPTVQYDMVASPGPDVLNNAKQKETHAQWPSVTFPSKTPSSNGLDPGVQQFLAGGGGAHDPGLLALLLRNPELVSQLNSTQAAYPVSGNANPGVFGQPPKHLKQMNTFGNNGLGLGLVTGDLGQEKGISSNNSKALGTPLQPGRSVSSVDQMPPESMQVQDTITMIPHGLGQQQISEFVPHGGVDNRFSTPQHSSVVARSAQDSSGWEQHRVSAPPSPTPPPPPLPSMQTVTNQALQPSMASHQNKQSNNWPESQATAWIGGGITPLRATQSHHPIPEHIRGRPQTIMPHNAHLPSFGGIAALPHVEGGSVTSVPQPEVQNQRPWPSGTRILPAHENAIRVQAPVHEGAGGVHLPVHDNAGRTHNRMHAPIQDNSSRMQENASRMHTPVHEHASRMHISAHDNASRMYLPAQEIPSRMHTSTRESASRMHTPTPENTGRMHTPTHETANRMYAPVQDTANRMQEIALRMQENATRMHPPTHENANRLHENASRIHSPMHENANRIPASASRAYTPMHESASRIQENVGRIQTPMHESASRMHENASRISAPLHESASRMHEITSRLPAPMHDGVSRVHENAPRILTPLHESASRMHDNASRIQTAMHENASRIHAPMHENANRNHTPVHENANRMHVAGQEAAAAVRNDRWLRPNVNVRSGTGRELADLGVRNLGGQASREFSNLSDGGSRQANVVDGRSMWVSNERGRSAVAQLQARYGLPQQPSPFPAAPVWQQVQDRSNSRPIQGAGSSFPLRRDVRPPQQQQLWNGNLGPASRQVWRGPQ